MLLVPQVKQPHEYACLPTCVWVVLTFLGREVSFEEVLEACSPGPFGVLQEIATQALEEAGWDVTLIKRVEIASIRKAIDAGNPVIASLRPPVSVPGHFAHAVVVCGLIEDKGIRVMDPAVGAYRDFSLDEFMLLVEDGLAGPFLIGAATPVKSDSVRS
jgi:hypothetical protein